MKANEAPEKVYLHQTKGSHVLNGKYYEYKPAKIRVNDKIIEYTRTDAFIEKACEYIANNMRCDGYTLQTKAKFIKGFANYMKGE